MVRWLSKYTILEADLTSPKRMLDRLLELDDLGRERADEMVRWLRSYTILQADTTSHKRMLDRLLELDD